MEDFFNDVEEDLLQSSHPPRTRKKIKKRRQLNALLKYRPAKLKSNYVFNDVLQTSDDQLSLTYHNRFLNKKLRWRNERFCRLLRLSFGLIFLAFLIVFWIVLLRNNINLRSEVHDLSQRLSKVEEKSSQIELQNVSSILRELNRRGNWTDLSSRMEKLNNEVGQLKIDSLLSQSLADESFQLKKLNESLVQWINEMKVLRNDLEKNNSTSQLESFSQRYERFVELVHNSSDKTSAMLNDFQSNFNRLRIQLEQCKC